MKNNFLNVDMIDSKKKVIILHINLLPELKNIESFRRDILQFIGKLKKNYTFVVPTFTKRFFFRTGKIDHYNKNKKCINGYFANSLINSKTGFRGNHSTHSYYFIGKEAKIFADMTKYDDGPFEILNKIGISNISFINVNFKSLPTFHIIENKLGYSKHILSNLLGSYYKSKNKKLSWIKLKYLNGCDKKYYNLFQKYLNKNIILKKKKGNSFIYYGSLIKIYEFDLKFMQNNFKYFNCKKCLYCKIINEQNVFKIILNILKNCKLLLLIFIKFIKGQDVHNLNFK